MCAGGVFGSNKNSKTKRITIIKDIFVQPHMGDKGLCIVSSFSKFKRLSN